MTRRACSASRSRRAASRGAAEGSARRRMTQASSPGLSGGSTVSPACSRRPARSRTSSKSTLIVRCGSLPRAPRTRRPSTVMVTCVSWAIVSGPALPTRSRYSPRLAVAAGSSCCSRTKLRCSASEAGAAHSDHATRLTGVRSRQKPARARPQSSSTRACSACSSSANGPPRTLTVALNRSPSTMIATPAGLGPPWRHAGASRNCNPSRKGGRSGASADPPVGTIWAAHRSRPRARRESHAINGPIHSCSARPSRRANVVALAAASGTAASGSDPDARSARPASSSPDPRVRHGTGPRPSSQPDRSSGPKR